MLPELYPFHTKITNEVKKIKLEASHEQLYNINFTSILVAMTVKNTDGRIVVINLKPTAVYSPITKHTFTFERNQEQRSYIFL